MEKDTKSVIKIHVNNTEHGSNLYNFLEMVRIKGLCGGDLSIENKIIGRDVSIRSLRVKNKDNKSIIKINMDNIDNAKGLYKALSHIKDNKPSVGNFILDGKIIGYNMKIQEITHKLQGGEDVE